MLRRLACAFLLLCLFPAWAAAQDPRVYVVTVGPGEAVYELFGHNALLFIDEETGTSVAYDWGRFDFAQPNFIGRFIRGDMLYSSGAAPGHEILAFYASQKRDVTLQELNLSAEQASSLLQACEVGYLPENRDYRYDYFTDNCSTRLRDTLNAALDGQLEAQLEGVETNTTYRAEGERHTARNWPLWFGFHAGFGRWAEQPIDAWEQSFLPDELREYLNQVEVTDADGERVPLVAQEIVLNEGVFPPVPADPPNRWGQTGLMGLGIGGVMLLMSRWRRPRPARLAAALWYLFAGLGGLFLLSLWAFTGHVAGHANQTILLVSPLGLPLAVITPLRRWPHLTQWLAVGHLGLCLIGVALYLIPGLGQENAAVVTLALPINLAATWVAGVRPHWRTKPGDDTSAPKAVPVGA